MTSPPLSTSDPTHSDIDAPSSPSSPCSPHSSSQSSTTDAIGSRLSTTSPPSNSRSSSKSSTTSDTLGLGLTMPPGRSFRGGGRGREQTGSPRQDGSFNEQMSTSSGEAQSYFRSPHSPSPSSRPFGQQRTATSGHRGGPTSTFSPDRSRGHSAFRPGHRGAPRYRGPRPQRGSLHSFGGTANRQSFPDTTSSSSLLTSGDSSVSGSDRDLRVAPRPVARILGHQHWANLQVMKIRVLGFPPNFTTRQVYDVLTPYGKITRIELIRAGGGAWVDFQPPPRHTDWMANIRVKSTQLRVEVFPWYPGTVSSPVDRSRYYQKLNILSADSLDFGISTGEKAMMVMHTIADPEPDTTQLMLDLERKKVHVRFSQSIGKDKYMYKFELSIPSLQTVYKTVDGDTGRPALVIPFNSPPRFFRFAKNDEELSSAFRQNDKGWRDYLAWYRQTDVVDIETELRLKSEPLMMRNKPIINIGQWRTYRFMFTHSTFGGAQFKEFMAALSDHGISVGDANDYQLHSRHPSCMWSFLREEISTTHPNLAVGPSDVTLNEILTNEIYLSFPLRYQLEACLSNGYLEEHSISRRFLERLSETPEALHILEKVMDKQKVFYDPMEIFNILIKSKDMAKKIPSYCYWARAVNITPTMMHVASPAMETSNRIIRKYSADNERFIRVKFTEEKTEGPVSGDATTSKAVYDRVARAMKHGIIVAGRYYEFLAFGNSQFRESGAYFYASTKSKSADDIRSELGDFTHIKTVAKYGARLGQTLSTTRPISTTVHIKTIPDIERNGYCFTDGVGKISYFMAQMAAQQLGFPDWHDNPPSLFQFRLAGCKGVLALDPQLRKNVICIRKSQTKFEAENKGLEIIRSSAFATAFFNRQLIIVLSTLGVPDDTFLKRQQEWMNDLEVAMKDERTAVDKLKLNVDFNHTTLTMAAMVLEGFMNARDPFMMSLLHLWRAYNIKALKEKARIFIEKGAFVLGCVDETATLHGHHDDPQLNATREKKLATLPEIFIQVTDTQKPGHYKIIEDICILARNPSLHPGDIRIVRAVNVPQLHHLKDVVVLPQTGDRDIANMCSGGDLDGDDYLVMWDADFLPETINEPPMDFTPPQPDILNRPVTVSDIADFFVTYMQNNTLGQIANAHLAQADFNEEGVKDPVCLDLAKLHSQAVDYPKSGKAAKLGRCQKPKKWPHFMEKKHLSEHQIYHSIKVLGKLYDQVERVDFKPLYRNEFDPRVLEAFELDDSILQTATALKASFDADVQRLMAKHGIRTEFEAWTVFVLEHNQEARDYKFAEEFGRAIGDVKKTHVERCRDAAEKSGVGFLQFVAGTYAVTAQEMKEALAECEKTEAVGGKEVPLRTMDPDQMPLMSFPWLFPRELGQIATGSTKQVELLLDLPMPIYPKKPKRTEVALDPGTGDVESSEGVTHYGEILKLDFDGFGDQGNQAEQQKPAKDGVCGDSEKARRLVSTGECEKPLIDFQSMSIRAVESSDISAKIEESDTSIPLGKSSSAESVEEDPAMEQITDLLVLDTKLEQANTDHKQPLTRKVTVSGDRDSGYWDSDCAAVDGCDDQKEILPDPKKKKQSALGKFMSMSWD